MIFGFSGPNELSVIERCPYYRSVRKERLDCTIIYRINNTIARLTKLDQERKSTPSFIKCSSMVFIGPTVNNEIDMQPLKNSKIY